MTNAELIKWCRDYDGYALNIYNALADALEAADARIKELEKDKERLDKTGIELIAKERKRQKWSQKKGPQ